MSRVPGSAGEGARTAWIRGGGDSEAERTASGKAFEQPRKTASQRSGGVPGATAIGLSVLLGDNPTDGRPGPSPVITLRLAPS